MYVNSHTPYCPCSGQYRVGTRGHSTPEIPLQSGRSRSKGQMLRLVKLPYDHLGWSNLGYLSGVRRLHSSVYPKPSTTMEAQRNPAAYNPRRSDPRTSSLQPRYPEEQRMRQALRTAETEAERIRGALWNTDNNRQYHTSPPPYNREPAQWRPRGRRGGPAGGRGGRRYNPTQPREAGSQNYLSDSPSEGTTNLISNAHFRMVQGLKFSPADIIPLLDKLSISGKSLPIDSPSTLSNSCPVSRLPENPDREDRGRSEVESRSLPDRTESQTYPSQEDKNGQTG
jgi:hypothetical protein